MSKIPARGNFRGLDCEQVKVGKGCVYDKALAIQEDVHHQFCQRRKRAMECAYQVGETEVVTPTRHGSSGGHVWRFLTGHGVRWVRVTVLTLGATTSSNAGDDARLTGSSTTDAGGDFAHVTFAVPPTTTLSGEVLHAHHKDLQVTPDTLETITVTQGASAANTIVRILALRVEELPAPTIDPAVDTWALDQTQWAPGTDIIDTEYEDLPIGCQTLRRFHKKVLFSLNKEMATTSAALVDLVTKSAANLLQYDIDTSVNLPETAQVAITCRVLAKSTDSAATVRFAFGSGNVDVVVNNAAATWFASGPATNIAKLTDTLSLQGQDDAGTLTVYAVEVYENTEAS